MSEIIFVKYCPLCGAENPRQQAFCTSCFDGDLSTVPVEPRRAEQATAPLPPAPAKDTACPAEAPDEPVGARETRRVEATPLITLELLDDPSIRFTVKEGQTVGRTKKADIMLQGVPKLDWISGIHARVFRQGEQWYIQHLGETNFIKVDGEMYKGREEVAFYDGSIVIFSLTAFRVSLGGK